MRKPRMTELEQSVGVRAHYPIICKKKKSFNCRFRKIFLQDGFGVSKQKRGRKEGGIKSDIICVVNVTMENYFSI